MSREEPKPRPPTAEEAFQDLQTASTYAGMCGGEAWEQHCNLRRDKADALLRHVRELRAERERLLRHNDSEAADYLRREGYRLCDAPACNCGSWHAVGGWHERFREIEAVISAADVGRNGQVLVYRVKQLVAQRDEALAAANKHMADAERERAAVVKYGRIIVDFADSGMFTEQVDEMQAKALAQFIDHIERGDHAGPAAKAPAEPAPRRFLVGSKYLATLLPVGARFTCDKVTATVLGRCADGCVMTDSGGEDGHFNPRAHVVFNGMAARPEPPTHGERCRARATDASGITWAIVEKDCDCGLRAKAVTNG